MNPGTILIRADANTSIGSGHVMRCLALAQVWQDAGGQAVFAMADVNPAIRARVEAESCDVIPIQGPAGTSDDALRTVALAREKHAVWVVVDGYQFSAEFHKLLKIAGRKVLLLDDNGHARHYSADLVLNQNLYADESMYERREPYTRLLLGTTYTLLRREFNSWAGWKREIPETGRKVLVTFGGSDPGNLTRLVIQATRLINIEGLETVAVVGASNPHYDSLREIAAETHHPVRLERSVSNMAALMAWADLAVSAAGTTCLEMCTLGLPAIVVTVAENQRASARELDRRGCVVHLGEAEEVRIEKIADAVEKLLNARELRQSLSRRGREIVDGDGAKRVYSAMQEGSLTP